MPACSQRKVPYGSRREARAAAKRRGGGSVNGGNLRPYKCACGYYHLTTRSKRAKSYRPGIRKEKGDAHDGGPASD